MSHEIRTPINTIIGLNEIILRGDISEDVAENARNIQDASKVLVNLLNNAVKYTSKGSITLSVRCERLALNRVRVWYSVEDTGQGFGKENSTGRALKLQKPIYLWWTTMI